MLDDAITTVPDMAPSCAPEAPPEIKKKPPQQLRFGFTGSAREYFGIWIVNTLLKIVTLGAYTAWAKVRKRRYFYGCTNLNNASFDYLADPKVLFRGWLIAVCVLLLYSFGSKASPGLSGLFSLLFFIIVPWLVVRSRVFNQRNSAHRNIRFDFRTDYREAYVVFAGLPILLPFTLGLLFPYMIYRQKRFFVVNSAFGETSCSFDATPKDYYRLFVLAAGWLLLLAVALVVGVQLVSATMSCSPFVLPATNPDGAMIRQKMAVLIGTVAAISLISIYFFFAIYIQTAVTNLTWNSTLIGRSRFASTLRVRDMAWLYLSSGLAIFLSLGLLIPWVSVRLARYRIENLLLTLTDDPEALTAANPEQVGAAGEEIGDLFNVDVAL